MIPSGNAVEAFLYYGYIPRSGGTLHARLAGMSAASSRPARESDRDLVARGCRCLMAGFTNLGSGRHVVPLSGGLDSRAILGALIAAGAREQVIAVTIGTPGMLDYELGARVAAMAGVAHETIDLRRVAITSEALESALLGSDATTWAFDAFFHRLIPSRFGPEPTYWSGFMGDPLAGSHLPATPSPSWAQALRHFAEHNRFSAGESLVPAEWDPVDVLPEDPLLPNASMEYEEQLDCAIRQEQYIQPTVLVGGYHYRTPFVHPEWVGFIRGVPRSLRLDERLYRQVLEARFPTLLRLATKDTLGLSPQAPSWLVTARRRLLKGRELLSSRHRRVAVRDRRFPIPFALMNYLDLDAELRRREDLRDLASSTLDALDARGVAPWIKGRELWARFVRRRDALDTATAVSLLIGLEVNLRADAKRSEPRFRLS